MVIAVRQAVVDGECDSAPLKGIWDRVSYPLQRLIILRLKHQTARARLHARRLSRNAYCHPRSGLATQTQVQNMTVAAPPALPIYVMSVAGAAGEIKLADCDGRHLPVVQN